MNGIVSPMSHPSVAGTGQPSPTADNVQEQQTNHDANGVH